MKTSLLLLVLITCAFSIPTENATSKSVLLFKEAIKQQKITADIQSNGGHDAGSVRLNLKNTSSSILKINIPSGTVFIPEDAGDQDLLLIEDEMIVLQPKQGKELILDAYCIESSDASPVENQKMTFKNIAPTSNLSQLCAHLQGKKNNTSDIQSAVWAVADGEPLEHIGMGTPSADALRTTVSDLTGQENSWYTVGVNRSLTEDRRIETSSASISGKLKINLSAPAEVSEKVVDSEGNVKFTMKGSTFPKAGEWNYSFNIRVMGWKKGDYRVLVFQGEKQIHTFPFSV